jgi:Mg2+ and Co2+ transporter CorA
VIRVHTLEKLKLHSKDVDSLSELLKLTKEASWFWLDCVEPNEEEMTMIAEIIRNDKLVSAVKKKQISSQYEKINDHLLISLSLVIFREKLETHPIYVFTNEKIFITVRSKDLSELVNDTLKTFQDCILKVKCNVASSFVISRLFHELTNKNLDTIIALRECIDKLEEKALAKP